MEYLALTIIGFLSGILYAEEMKRRKNPLYSFPLRFGILGTMLFFVLQFFGADGGFIFVISHVIGRLLWVFYRAFVRP
ncbi:hypothetical protein [Aquifex pyrophilus]